VRLLLDEHHPATIARQLRDRGHDVTAVVEHPNLRELGDRAIWSHAVSERRAVVTEDAKHFMPIVIESAAGAEPHFGVVFTSPRSMPRGRETIGLFVETLDGFLARHPADDALADQVAWLSPAAG
jgi:hypothetical protein